MSSRIERQVAEVLEEIQAIAPSDGWCSTCVHETDFQVIMGDAEVKRCPDCGRVLGPLDGTRVIRIRQREDGPQ